VAAKAVKAPASVVRRPHVVAEKREEAAEAFSLGHPLGPTGFGSSLAGAVESQGVGGADRAQAVEPVNPPVLNLPVRRFQF
jgi:FAD/FMN-containing dehydrogenase